MTKNKSISIFATAIVLSSMNNAIADSTIATNLAASSVAGSKDLPGATSNNDANRGNAAAPAKHSSLAKKFLGVVTGAIVGTPVCMFRKPIDEDKYAVADLTGNSDKGRAIVPTSVIWAPFSGVAGVLEAPFCAVNNSLVNYNKPFSKEQFSLVKPSASIEKEEARPVPHGTDVR